MFRDYKKQQTGQKNKIMYIILEGGLSASHEKKCKSRVDATLRVNTDFSVYAYSWVRCTQVTQQVKETDPRRILPGISLRKL